LSIAAKLQQRRDSILEKKELDFGNASKSICDLEA
jgi:hypothetical protein